REEELFNQYFKMAKKVRAGADFIIAQIGLDFAKHRELLEVARLRLPGVPLLAAILSPSPRTARWIRAGGAPGVSLTDDLLRLSGEEAEAPDGGRAARRRRLALQMVGLELAGYSGVQLTGVHTVAGARELLDTAAELRASLPDLPSWQEAWDAALRLHDGRVAATAPAGGFYLAEAGAVLSGPRAQVDSTAKAGFGGQAKFHFLDAVDRAIFQDRAPAAGVMRLLSVGHIPVLDRALLRLEQTTKEPLVGCRSCGFCRLPYTQYVCPETCPKGLANGPCGGTSNNRCEFGDRECIHNQRYRLSKALSSTAELEALLVPPVPGTRGTCSWTNHFRGQDPRVIALPEHPASRPLTPRTTENPREGPS
ncbi:MAG: methylenetetrahydrofolate reductase C-terminal domain-containing protein, partial [Chloroflexota bacterium]